ncbi:MAG: hypothetical protein HQL24_05525 [Candidatus Omnitrophica bacterium]|nr:hypothetical protein [Candidatus Omnitrophota bacterium]
MFKDQYKYKKSMSFRLMTSFVLLAFILSLPGTSLAQSPTNFSAPGALPELTQSFSPSMVRGLKVYPDDPLKFSFIVDTGDAQLDAAAFKKESQKLINYFLAALTVPENDFWVNLSPQEKNRIAPQALSRTEMGRDMLAQDYVLKQLTSSLMYPEKELGRKFWDAIYKKISQQYGNTDIPVNTLSRVWIVPDKATVYEKGVTAFVVERHLKVMLEEEYLAASKTVGAGFPRPDNKGRGDRAPTAIIKEIIIPALEKEVNEGKAFANLRQIFNSMILATWYKKRLKESLLGKVYVNKNKVTGIDLAERDSKEKIYNQYQKSFREGLYNYIKEEYDRVRQEVIPRKYFSGGIAPGVANERDLAIVTDKNIPEKLRQAVTTPKGADTEVTFALHEKAADHTIFANTESVLNYFRPLLNPAETRKQKEIRAAFPLLHGYLFPVETSLNFDLEKPTVGDAKRSRAKNFTLVNHIFQRALGRKIRGLEENNINIFQTDNSLSESSFQSVSKKFTALKEAGVLPYFLTAFLYHDVAKSGYKKERDKWKKIPDVDMLIPNKASALILRSMEVPNSSVHGLFENIENLRNHPQSQLLNEFFYRIIAIRGYAGQFVRGEVGYAVFEELTDWIRTHFQELKGVLAANENDAVAAQRITDVIYLFDFVDVSAVREGLMTDSLNSKFLSFYNDFKTVITPDKGIFRENWQDIFTGKWGDLSDVSMKRNYLKDRLNRFRVARQELGEDAEKINQYVDKVMTDDEVTNIVELLHNFQGWYVEDATSGLTVESQIKLIALSIIFARKEGLDISRPFNINYSSLMKVLAKDRQDYDRYKIRILETFLRKFKLSDVFKDDSVTAMLKDEEKSPLLGADMKIDGQKAVLFDFHLKPEADALLVLLKTYESRSSVNFHQLLKLLMDAYGLRKDEFDRVSNEMSYLSSMAAARSDKEKLARYSRGPVVLDVGAAGGAMLDLLEEYKDVLALKRAVGLDVSEEALEKLEIQKKEKGWSIVDLIKGDALELEKALKENGITAPNTIIFCSIMHEIFSYVTNKEGKKFSMDTVRHVLKTALQLLPANGRILFRDGLIPEDGEKEQIMMLYGKDNKKFFDKYIDNFEGRPITYQIISEDEAKEIYKIKILRKDAMEFLYTLTWGWESFPYEVREQYGVLTRQGYIKLFHDLADEAGLKIKEIELPVEDQSYLQPGYVEHLNGKAELFDLDGKPADLPPSNMMIVIEKQSDNNGNPVKNGDRALLTDSKKDSSVGGIDFNSNRMELFIRRDNNGVPLSLSKQPLENMRIDGFQPVILNINVLRVPITAWINSK